MVKIEKTRAQKAVEWLNGKTQPATWPAWVIGTIVVLSLIYIACRIIF